MTSFPTLPIGPFEHVSMDDTDHCMKGLSYERFAMLAIAAIEELKTDHDALERRLAAQEGMS